jgi:hypothetical protein
MRGREIFQGLQSADFLEDFLYLRLMPIRSRFILLSVLFLGATVYFVVSLWKQFAMQEPWDFAINWTAAQSMRRGLSLYSPDDLRQLGQLLIGPDMVNVFRDPFTSYIGPPATAMLLLPFTLLRFPEAVLLYRIGLVLAFGASIFLAGLAFTPLHRMTAWVVGLFSLLLFQPVVLSIQLGQVDALVMLGLATSLWALGRGNWWLVGVGVGFATVLKISPAILILYLLLRGKRQAVAGAILTAAALLGAAAIAGRASDLWLFVHDVAPSLSNGTLHIQNQSLPAWFARIFSPDTDLMSYMHGLGGLSLLGLALALGGTVLFYWKTRSEEITLGHLGLLVLLALIAGPITWDHYVTWAILPGMLLVNEFIWSRHEGRLKPLSIGCLILGFVLLMVPTPYFSDVAIAGNWMLRLLTGTKTVGLILWFVVICSYVLAGRANIFQGVISRNRYSKLGPGNGEIA